MLVVCSECGTHQDYSVLAGEVSCHECGASGESLTPAEERSDSSDDESSHTALLAEDDADLRENYDLWLSAADSWECREAEDGAETLEKLDGAVDVLVLDRRMPALSGSEVVEKLEGTLFDGNIVVVSAYEEDAHLRVADVEAYLTKPVRKDTFVDTLERVVSSD